MDPLKLFEEWYKEEAAASGAVLPGACCLTTLGLDGFPNSRFVSLKEVRDGCFIITGPMDARKGKEIAANPKVALAFWWPATQRQVRIQGVATPVSPEAAAAYFAGRDIAAQLVSAICEQGKPVTDYDTMRQRFFKALDAQGDAVVARPANWGGYAITPLRIELMLFSDTRLHDRNYFEQKDGRWAHQKLQP
ncbi:pyridoxine/pyridoxamine 5'-phosphate oxidase [Niabella drilacis]|uniref:Pyridoxamine 5'-phosphate oxidase n=1 Tax=Niabella drilacis (strain DSM 25811 / CCM 8410 / CCUG 62505 / LMG 26954 / E90) TaxID=1285928 RepID=A0A1G6ZFR6_NIADE|nr:pyridoxal 5'-phosphate synthase [Niabella drilacis]SDE01524.1 Pyridoxamine 5'-phosphate oxidase [Niabella drilacis]